MSANRQAILTMIRCLQDHPCSVEELHKATGMWHSTIREWLSVMCKEVDGERLIHRCAWERTIMNNPIVPLYKWGHGSMARRPPKMTQAQRQARLRERKKLARLHGVQLSAVVMRVQ